MSPTRAPTRAPTAPSADEIITGEAPTGGGTIGAAVGGAFAAVCVFAAALLGVGVCVFVVCKRRRRRDDGDDVLLEKADGASGPTEEEKAADDVAAAVDDVPPTRCFAGVPLVSFDEAMHLLLTLDADVPKRPDVRRPTADEIELVPKYVRSKYAKVAKKPDVQALVEKHGLTTDDVMVIVAYTAEVPFPTYRWFNAWLNCSRRDEQVVKHVGPFFVLLFGALRKLPEQVVTASRGVNVRDIPKLVDEFTNYETRFADGAFVGHWGLSSYTTDPDVEMKFAGKHRAIVYICKHMRCVSIEPFSLVPAEAEVLPLPPATFKVKTAIRQGRMVRVVLVQEELADHAYVPLAANEIAGAATATTTTTTTTTVATGGTSPRSRRGAQQGPASPRQHANKAAADEAQRRAVEVARDDGDEVDAAVQRRDDGEVVDEPV